MHRGHQGQSSQHLPAAHRDGALWGRDDDGGPEPCRADPAEQRPTVQLLDSGQNQDQGGGQGGQGGFGGSDSGQDQQGQGGF